MAKKKEEKKKKSPITISALQCARAIGVNKAYLPWVKNFSTKHGNKTRIEWEEIFKKEKIL